jgi:serine/threonine protein kinase
MQLVAALRHGDDFLEFFPLAECSLKKCFEQNYVRNKSYFTWMILQLVGLAEGLHAIHGDAKTKQSSATLGVPTRTPGKDEILGYHHDLKADNILLLKDSGRMGSAKLGPLEKQFGTLQISDFGLGRFRPASTGSVSVHVKGTQSYAAPEATQSGGQSRPYDIWTFGCMLIEISVWLLEGPDRLQQFINSR